ncbi:MAG: ATP-binding protein [Acidobacteriota bacterium]|nr:ATP-binding protein [Acidobacteriota bacterium]
MSRKLSLEIDPRVEELSVITAAVEQFGDAERWPSDMIFQINLVIEELGLNIMTHGKTEELEKIEITLTAEGESLTVEIVDNGHPFDPTSEAPEPDLDVELGERTIGGLGIHIVRSLVDNLRYRRQGGRNHVTLVKERVR